MPGGMGGGSPTTTNQPLYQPQNQAGIDSGWNQIMGDLFGQWQGGQTPGQQYLGAEQTYLGNIFNNAYLNQAIQAPETGYQDYMNAVPSMQNSFGNLQNLGDLATGYGQSALNAGFNPEFQNVQRQMNQWAPGQASNMAGYEAQTGAPINYMHGLARQVGGMMPAVQGLAGQVGGLMGPTEGLAGQVTGMMPAVQQLAGQVAAPMGQLQGAASDILAQGYDPQNALFQRTQQQLMDQMNAANAMSGVQSSPYGAGLMGQGLSNFDINWQNNQLQRMTQAASSAQGLDTAAGGLGQAAGGLYGQAGQLGGLGGQLYGQAGALGQGAGSLYGQAGQLGQQAGGIDTQAGGLGAAAAGIASQIPSVLLSQLTPAYQRAQAANLGTGAYGNLANTAEGTYGQGASLMGNMANQMGQLGMAPYNAYQTAMSNNLGAIGQGINLMNQQYMLPEQLMGNMQSYMGLGQSASQLSNQIGAQNWNQMMQLGSGIGGLAGSPLLWGSQGPFGGSGAIGGLGSLLGLGGGGGAAAGGAGDLGAMLGGDTFGSLGTDALFAAGAPVGTIICTELVRQKRLSRKWWLAGFPVFDAYPERVKRGYYLWGRAAVRHLRKHPGSLLSKALEKAVVWRAEHVAAEMRVRGARKRLRGLLVRGLFYGVCSAIGAVVRKECDWREVYSRASV